MGSCHASIETMAADGDSLISGLPHCGDGVIATVRLKSPTSGFPASDGPDNIIIHAPYGVRVRLT